MKKELSPLERAQRYARDKQEPGRVIHAEKGWQYYHFDTQGRLEADLDVLRDHLHNMGFQPVNGPRYKGETRKEYVPGVATAEIWRADPDVVAYWRSKREERAVKEPGWLQVQKSRTKHGAFVPGFATERRG